MSIIVQKFGGTSVADSQKILAAARRAVRARLEGHQVVTVVSAMGHTTDALIDLAKQITESPPAREMDMLLSTGEQVSVALMAMAIHSLGHQAVSMTGAQMGILTDNTYTKARIHSIAADRVRRALDEGKIVIAAGFQGVDESANITTLGRGGSDTTAVALAAVLGAETCEIYTDVDGVYTTDPRVAPQARKMARISYEEMLELASLGAGVMHSRSIEFAKKFGVPIHVRSSFSDTPGTIIGALSESSSRPVCGAALLKNEARLTVRGVPDRPGAAMALFSRLAARNITMDMIVQNVAAAGQADISFTVLRDELPGALKACEEAVREVGAESVDYADDVAKVSVVGLAMARQSGVANKMFLALAEKGINIEMISTSEIKISVLVDRQYAQEALQTVHDAFELHQAPTDEAPAEPATAQGKGKGNGEIIARLRRLEDLMIEDITLDESQSRLTMVDLPDIPGLAAQVFDEIAEAGVLVDMIVQSIGRNQLANISFTVPQSQLDRALAVARQLAGDQGCPPPTHCAKVAKLSVFGVGIRSHTGVASRLFRSLAGAGVNVDMISTSEVRINVVVEAAQGRKALETLETEFADVRL